MTTVAIVGAGMAGLVCARRLQAAGMAVTVLEKSRGPGGRLSTRRREPHQYDHGAPFFTAADPQFVQWVQQWVQDGVVQPWSGIIGQWTPQGIRIQSSALTRYVGVPKMSALTRVLASGLSDVRAGVRVERVTAQRELFDTEQQSLGHFDWVVVATPAAQAVPLLQAAPTLARRAQTLNHAPCVVAMLTLDTPVSPPVDVLHFPSGPLTWAYRNASKPGRPPGESWVLHGQAEWSAAHLEADPQDRARMLVETFCQHLNQPLHTIADCVGHRWRYANIEPTTPLPGRAVDPVQRMAVCGDGWLGVGVEGAWRSGCAVADAVQISSC